MWSCIFLPFLIYTSIEWGPENITSSVGNRRRATILSKAGHDETDRRESKVRTVHSIHLLLIPILPNEINGVLCHLCAHIG